MRSTEPLQDPLPASGTSPHSLHDLNCDFSPCEFRIKWADSPWERRQAYALRHAVFCEEQRVFEGDDRDGTDDEAHLIVALACVAGLADTVVGTVRIHESSPGEWWGSRLAVARAYRSRGKLGATLIRLAVSSAHARGCSRFLAHVQSQNVALFHRLHWQTLRQLQLHGRDHCLMEAELGHYPACHTPYRGFVARSVESTA